MILPDKYTTNQDSLIGASAIVLSCLGRQRVPVEDAWGRCKRESGRLNVRLPFTKFIQTICFMFACGMIQCEKGGLIFNENLVTDDKR
ncbi:MAG: hypothetical protein LKG11_01645 [Bacilli bacterium]|jgi:hypothetical protein|nr:hypothetical protein [Bacilli bacterium]